MPRWFFLAAGLCLVLATQAVAVAPPDYLPRYTLELKLNERNHTVAIQQQILWTNPAKTPTRKLVVNFFPLYSVDPNNNLSLKKTLEMFRLRPSDAMSLDGPAGKIVSVTVPGAEQATPLSFQIAEDIPTAIEIDLPAEVPPGGRVAVQLEVTIRLPNKQGRWGHWDGIHSLVNAIPSVAFYDDAGWHPVPFVPWHQPFWNEAGVYSGTLHMPEKWSIGCGAALQEISREAGVKTLAFEQFIGRDLAIVGSPDLRTFTRNISTEDGQRIELTCLAFRHHAFYAEAMLDTLAEAIPLLCQWFGPFPYDHYTIAESYFGWNGNETSGMVLIDERVFDMPSAGRGYVDYLITHETCHQWWYNLVGNNGYSETYLDEGPATYFAHKAIDTLRGQNDAMIRWNTPGTPRILRDNYRYSSMIAAIHKNEMQPAAQSLDQFGHLHKLFTGAYDRGSKVFSQLEARLGTAAFHDFTREFIAEYSWRVIDTAIFKAELTEYSGKNWDEFFDHWVYSTGVTDWAVTEMTVSGQRVRRFGPTRRDRLPGSDGGYRVAVTVEQKRDFDEPTTLGLSFAESKGFPVRVPIVPGVARFEQAEQDLVVEQLESRRWRVTLTVPEPPTNAVIDPDRVLLDADVSNNSWVRVPRVALLPLYSMIDDTDYTNDYDRWNFKGGLWSGGALYPEPWYTRGTTFGAKASAYRTQEFQGGVYAGYRSDFDDLVIGVEALLDHWPSGNWQLGFNYEGRLAQFSENRGAESANRASVFGRYVIQQGSSLYLPPISYVDLYSTYQDQFLPFNRNPGAGSVRPDWWFLNGAHFRVNLLTPYWDPEEGFLLDASYAGGVSQLDRQETAHQLRLELTKMFKLPEGYGYFSDVPLAVRGVFAQAWPVRGDYFALGGSTQFRGFDLAERQGSRFWVANAEARFPVLRDVKWNFVDRVVGVRTVSMAAFYDVGAVAVNHKRVGNVAHALGVGLRVNVSLFSFIERVTVRADAAKTLNASTPFQFWIGVQHPF